MWTVYMVLAVVSGHFAGRAIEEGDYRTAGRFVVWSVLLVSLYIYEVWTF